MNYLRRRCRCRRESNPRFLLEMEAHPEAPDEAGITPAQVTKRDDIAKALGDAIMAVSTGQRRPPPPPFS